MKLYNTLTHSIENFVPLHPPKVTMYGCGPTVYDYAHIGNFRTYTMTDVLVRALKFLGYDVRFVMNITDVGHLVSDADGGEDKMEKGARREGKTVWNIAQFYTDAFLEDSRNLNLIEPDVRPKATGYITEQIKMVEILLSKGAAYRLDDGIYFDTSRFRDYEKLTGQDSTELKVGARVEENPKKRNPYDFALWKFSPPGAPRQMEWFFEGSHRGELVTHATRIATKNTRSDWSTIGFPGWHIECSAMIKKELGDQIDVHTGGVDLVPIHHTNEIAQSETASGTSPFVKYWVHGQFILVDGEKMAKSKGNFYRLADIEAKGYEPLALRYLYLTAHYRKQLNFTWESLRAAQEGLKNLRELCQASQGPTLREPRSDLNTTSDRTVLSEEKLAKIQEYSKRFKASIENDLQMPEALVAMWEVAKSNIPARDKRELIEQFDQVLGLDLLKGQALRPQGLALSDKQIPADIHRLVEEREKKRDAKDWNGADALRRSLVEKGWIVEDSQKGPTLHRSMKHVP